MKLRQNIGEKPLWSQLYDILEEQITSGKYKTGDLLPSEKELMEMYEVSRVTVRQAMDKLLTAGMISRERGKGTIVIKSDTSVATSFKSSFNGVTEKNNDTDRRVISVEFAEPTPEVAYFFEITKETKVLKLTRQTFVNNQPLTHYETYLNPIVPVDLNTDFSISMYQSLEENGYRITKVREKITASIMNDEDLILFAVKDKEAIMNRIRMGYSQDTPIEYTYSKYVANGYELEIELS